MTVQWGCTVLRLHPLLPCLLALSVMAGDAGFLFPMLAALLWHETGHALACRAFHLEISAVEVTPFGGVMRVEGLDAAPPIRRFLVALGGPLFSLLGLILLSPVDSLLALPYAFTRHLARQHLILLLFNLLPAPPLDGGRMAQAVLARFLPADRTEKLLRGLSCAAAFLLCLLSVLMALRGVVNLAPAFSGLFLLYAAWVERSRLPVHYVSTLIGRRAQISAGKALPVRIMAVGPEMTVSRAAALLTGRQYHELWVLSPDGMTVTGKIGEQAFCDALLSRGDQRVGELSE